MGNLASSKGLTEAKPLLLPILQNMEKMIYYIKVDGFFNVNKVSPRVESLKLNYSEIPKVVGKYAGGVEKSKIKEYSSAYESCRKSIERIMNKPNFFRMKLDALGDADVAYKRRGQFDDFLERWGKICAFLMDEAGISYEETEVSKEYKKSSPENIDEEDYDEDSEGEESEPEHELSDEPSPDEETYEDYKKKLEDSMLEGSISVGKLFKISSGIYSKAVKGGLPDSIVEKSLKVSGYYKEKSESNPNEIITRDDKISWSDVEGLYYVLD